MKILKEYGNGIVLKEYDDRYIITKSIPYDLTEYPYAIKHKGWNSWNIYEYTNNGVELYGTGFMDDEVYDNFVSICGMYKSRIDRS